MFLKLARDFTSIPTKTLFLIDYSIDYMLWNKPKLGRAMLQCLYPAYAMLPIQSGLLFVPLPENQMLPTTPR
jgi:hypothetical protein